MHIEAYAYVARALVTHAIVDVREVVEIGGRNINGSIAGLFAHAARYTATDIEAGDGVSIVAPGETYQHDSPIDVAVCCEVLEHAADWQGIIRNMARQLAPGGWLIITTAGPARAPHSAIDGGPVRDGEYYGNLTEQDLITAVQEGGLTVRDASRGREGHDVSIVAQRASRLAGTARHATVHLGASSGDSKIEINGVDVSPWTKTISVRQTAGGCPEVVITLTAGLSVDVVAEQAAVLFEEGDSK